MRIAVFAACVVVLLAGCAPGPGSGAYAAGDLGRRHLAPAASR